MPHSILMILESALLKGYRNAMPHTKLMVLESALLQGYRYAMPHSILMMHHPSGASRGQASDMQIESRELVSVWMGPGAS
jgi:ATP-dependent protease ClpP protease subunit